MNKAELITAIAEHANLTKADANRALDGLLKTIETTLASGDSVALVGFGSFEVKAKEQNARAVIHKLAKKSPLLRQIPLLLSPAKP